MKSKNENKSYTITECYTESYATTKFRHAHVITLIFVGMIT